MRITVFKNYSDLMDEISLLRFADLGCAQSTFSLRSNDSDMVSREGTLYYIFMWIHFSISRITSLN